MTPTNGTSSNGSNSSNGAGFPKPRAEMAGPVAKGENKAGNFSQMHYGPARGVASRKGNRLPSHSEKKDITGHEWARWIFAARWKKDQHPLSAAPR